MQHTTAVVGRWTLAIATSLGLATVANYANHKGYWEGTIHRVQTVDFNILSHMLPTKLSYALLEGNSEELQRTLDSNYGLFGLVVTDCQTDTLVCSDQNILYASESYLDWRTELDNQGVNFLISSEAPYSVLRDPPPLLTTDGYEDSRDETWDATGLENEGEVIGRVYYVRGIPPSFWNYYRRWITGIPSGSLLSDSGAYKYFSLTVALFLFGGLAGVGVLETVIAQKRLQEEKLNRTAEKLKAVHQERNKLLGEKNILLADLRKIKAEKINLGNQLKQQRQDYESQLEERLAISQHNRTKIETLEREISLTLEKQGLDQIEIREREQVIKTLTSQIEDLQSSENDNKEILANLTQQINFLREGRERSKLEIEELNQQIKTIEDSKEQLIEQTHLLESGLSEVKNEEDSIKEKNQKLLEKQIKANEHLRKELEYYASLADRYEKENRRLQNNLENQAAIQEYFKANPSQNDSETPISSKEPEIDFFIVRIGLVGGHEDLHNKIIENLYKLGLQKEPKQIFSFEHNTRRDIKNKLMNCNFIAVFLYYSGHPTVKIFKRLHSRGAFENSFVHFFNERRAENSDIINEVISVIISDFDNPSDSAA